MEVPQTRDLSVVQIWRYILKRRYTLLAFMVSGRICWQARARRSRVK